MLEGVNAAQWVLTWALLYASPPPLYCAAFEIIDLQRYTEPCLVGVRRTVGPALYVLTISRTVNNGVRYLLAIDVTVGVR